MALKAQINAEEHGTLAENLQTEYAEKDGKFTLSVTAVDGYDLQNIGALTNALEQERENVRGLNSKVTAFADLDPGKAREALQVVADLKSGKLKDEHQAAFNTQVEELVNKHTEELSTKDKAIGTIRGQLQREMIEARAAVLMSEKEVGGNPALLMPHVLREAKMEEDGDTFRVSVVDPSTGRERMSLDGERAGKPMNLRELLLDMKKRDQLQGGFAAPNASGTGGEHATGAGGKGGAQTISTADARDPAKYRKARAAAEKAGVPLSIV